MTDLSIRLIFMNFVCLNFVLCSNLSYGASFPSIKMIPNKNSFLVCSLNFLIRFILYWLRWIHSLHITFAHYNKSWKSAKVSHLSNPNFIVSYEAVSSILLPRKKLPLRIEIQGSNNNLSSQCSLTVV